MMTIAPKGRIHLYELVNYGRRETLVVLTGESREGLLSRLASPRPEPIAHWGIGEAFNLETIVEAIHVDDAEEFLKLYRENTRTSGWTTFVWRGRP